MSNVTPDLTTFLLARIAEDEAQARNYAEAFGPDRPDGGMGILFPPPMPDAPGRPFPSYGDPYMLISFRRVLAECSAKRKIIAECEALEEGYVDPAGDDILGLLAIPYITHPDCPSWVVP